MNDRHKAEALGVGLLGLGVLLGGALMGVIRASLTHWQAGGCEGDLLAMGQEAVALLERGVGGDHTERHIHASRTA